MRALGPVLCAKMARGEVALLREASLRVPRARPEDAEAALDETSDSLQARFRAVEVVLPDDGRAPVNLPGDWLHAEQAGRTLRFTASRFGNDAALAAVLREAVPGAAQHEVRAMSLREIFVALARAYRLEGK